MYGGCDKNDADTRGGEQRGGRGRGEEERKEEQMCARRTLKERLKLLIARFLFLYSEELN